MTKTQAGVSSGVLAVAVFVLAGCGDGILRGATNEGDGHAPFLKTTPTVPRTSSTPSTPGTPASSNPSGSVIGRSVQGRQIRAYVVGNPTAPRHVLVVGCVHGDETAGEAITRRLRGVKLPAGVALWLVDEFNPDGCSAHTRQNAHGVDLNRNSPWHWRHLDHPGGTYYSGTGPLSEPESRAIYHLVLQVQPAVTIWYHQHATLVDASGGDEAIERRYASLVGLPFRHFGLFPGSITSWQNATFTDDTAFVVELPAGELSMSAVSRHVRAALEVAQR